MSVVFDIVYWLAMAAGALFGLALLLLAIAFPSAVADCRKVATEEVC